MKKIIFHWVISTLAVMVAAYVLPGASVDGILVAFVVAVVLGIINTFIKPVVSILTLPISALTLGIFSLVINALFVMLVDRFVEGFHVAGFWWALIFSVFVSLINFVLHNKE
ncbi:MAG: phage holin family protein [Candidatus Moranbacteria bacterium]|nr:phage holin family protein [Candidatus Moranbacteria bacterium]